MNINTDQVAQQCIDAINSKIKNLKKLNIIIVGKSGVGKSTLINSVFRGNLTETGLGRPVTSEMRKIEKSDFPLAIYDTPGFELSQGQQKLAVIANALIGAPPLLIFDEACQGMDSQHRRVVLSLLESIAPAASSWLTVLYVSHHDDDALAKVTTHVLELEKGRVAFVVSDEELQRVEEGRRK